MDQLPNLLNDDEVLYVNAGRVLMANPTFKVEEFLDALAQAISEREGDWSDECEGWFGEGLRCEVLRFTNQGWQRGRVRIRLEFFPETQKLLREERPRRASLEGRPPREEIYSRRDEVSEAYGEPNEGDY